MFLLAEFFLRKASVRRFRCVRRKRFLSERRPLSSLGFLCPVNFAATFFFSLVSSDSPAIFFAIRIRASSLLALTTGSTVFSCSLVERFAPCQSEPVRGPFVKRSSFNVKREGPDD
jgi:hypothetical protein